MLSLDPTMVTQQSGHLNKYILNNNKLLIVGEFKFVTVKQFDLLKTILLDKNGI
jgi:hypothetical protein